MARFEIDGVILTVPDDLLNKTLEGKLSSGEYEGSEARATRMRVKQGLRVLELGGGVGYISSICAQLTEPSNITLVEANPGLLPIIRANLDENGGKDVEIIHGAIVNDSYESAGTLFRIGKVFWGSSLADAKTPAEQVVEVPAIELGTLFDKRRPHVVILDIEGAEQFLFEKLWPKFVRQVIMELHPKRYEASTIQKMVDCMSRSGLTYDPACSRGTLIAFRRVFKK